MRKYQAHKPSGTPWLGDLTNDWGLEKIKFQGRVVSGSTPETNKSEYWNGEIVWATPVDFGENNQKYILKSERTITAEGLKNIGGKLIPKGSVVISSRAPIGLVAIAGVDLTTNQGCKSVIPKKINGEYLFYCLKEFSIVLENLGNETVFAELSMNALKNFFLPIPTPPEQQSIVHFLNYKTEQIDDFITSRQKQNELLKEQKASIINKAVTKGINPDAKMKPSGIEWIGKIPKNWDVWKLKYLVKKISKGTTPSTEGRELLDSGIIRFIKAENITPDGITVSPEFFIDEETNNILKRSQLQHNDILFVIAGATIGKAAIITNEFLPANTNQAVCFIRLKKRIMPELVFHQLQSNYIKNKMTVESVVAAQPNISMENIGNFQIFLPPIEEQEILLRYIHQGTIIIDNLIAKYQKQIYLMQEYRRSLISQAVTGKIDVREWQPKKKGIL